MFIISTKSWITFLTINLRWNRKSNYIILDLPRRPCACGRCHRSTFQCCWPLLQWQHRKSSIFCHCWGKKWILHIMQKLIVIKKYVLAMRILIQNRFKISAHMARPCKENLHLGRLKVQYRAMKKAPQHRNNSISTTIEMKCHRSSVTK